MNLTEEQQRFLLRYTNNKGDFYKTIESLGLDLAHITSWQQVSKDFAEAFRNTKRIVLEHLKEENYMSAMLRVNEALHNGITQHSVQQKHRIIGADEDGNEISEFEVIRTTKHLGVPSWSIQYALQETSIVKAVNLLAAEGILPSHIAKKILQSANKISKEIVESFEIPENAEYTNDKKVIALIKAAVLGEVE